jgi:hypothetical protein
VPPHFLDLCELLGVDKPGSLEVLTKNKLKLIAL